MDSTMMDLLSRARVWLDNDVDEATKNELKCCIDALEQKNELNAVAELSDRMCGNLEFGTAGLRGILGAGTNRMNRSVVIRTTAGLGAYLLEVFPDAKERGVVIGRDGRRGSIEFESDAVGVLSAMGIRVWIFDDVVPTPVVSFAVRALSCVAGIMITASHNPPEYNGYKVYWENAAQIIPPHDTAIAAVIDKQPGAKQIARLAVEDVRERGYGQYVPNSLLEDYYKAIEALSIHNSGRHELSVVYTAMHGVGDRYVQEVFRGAGFTNFHSVPEQQKPDGSFPTVRFPNPEEPGALDLSLALCKEKKADLLLANDPDADRLAVAVPDKNGQYVALSGNEVGQLLAYYLLTEHPSPANDRLVITTIVSSPLLGSMARSLGVRYDEVLTGFKWVANRAMQLEAETGTTFVMGYEEALGYTVGTVARDKDGVGAARIFAEFAALLKSRGQSVLEKLEEMYRRFGLVVSKQHNITRKGADGLALIQEEMRQARKAIPTSIGSRTVRYVCDYLAQTKTDCTTGIKTALPQPKSNVLAFELEGGSRVTMRPSGTEPKIKYYFDLSERVESDETFASAKTRAFGALHQLEEDFVALAQHWVKESAPSKV